MKLVSASSYTIQTPSESEQPVPVRLGMVKLCNCSLPSKGTTVLHMVLVIGMEGGTMVTVVGVFVKSHQSTLSSADWTTSPCV